MSVRSFLYGVLLMPVTLLAQLRITSPNGGEILVPGTTATIQWTGIAPSAKVTIEYSTNAGTLWLPVASGVSGLSFDWNVPNTISTTCLLRITLPQQILSDSILADGRRHNDGAYPNQFMWSPNGSSLGLGGANEVLDTGDLHTIFDDSTSNDPTLTLSPDGQTIILRRATGAQMFSVAQGTLLRNFNFALPFSVMWLNGDRHFIGIGQQTIRYDTASAIGIDTLKTNLWSYSMSHSWNSTDTRIAVAYGSGIPYAIMFDLVTGDSLFAMDAGEVCAAVSISPNDAYVLTVGQTNIFKVWDANTGALISSFSMPNYQAHTFQWSPDNRHVAIAAYYDSLMIWDALAGTVVHTLHLGLNPYDIGYRPGDGKWLLAEAGNFIFVYDPVTGMLLQQLDIFRPTISGPSNWGTGSQMQWSPLGDKVAIRDGAGRYAIIHVEERAAEQDLSDNQWSINDIAPETFSFRIGIDSAFAGEQVDLPMILRNPAGVRAQGATAIVVKFTYNSTLLEHLPIQDPNIVMSRSIGRADIAVTLDPTSTDSVIGFLHFRAGLGNAISTPITIDSARTNSPNALLAPTDGRFDLRGICYEGGPRLINPTGDPAIIVQRPIANSTIVVDLVTIEEGRTKLSLVDMSGRILKVILDDIVPQGRTKVTIGLDGVSTGKYLLVLRTPATQVSEQIEVVR